MKRLLLLTIICFVLMVGCSLPQWEVKNLVQEAVNEESWSSGDSIVISEVLFTDINIPQGAEITAARIVMVKR